MDNHTRKKSKINKEDQSLVTALKQLAEIMYNQYTKELQNERPVIEPNLKIFNKNK